MWLRHGFTDYGYSIGFHVAGATLRRLPVSKAERLTDSLAVGHTPIKPDWAMTLERVPAVMGTLPCVTAETGVRHTSNAEYTRVL